jgi:hypothetical protein
VYYDGNDDRAPGAGEGVAGLRIMVYDTITGEQVAEGMTNEVGNLRVTVAVLGGARVVIPYLGLGLVATGEGKVYIRLR